MWPKTFDQRLTDWYHLRQTVKTLPLASCLESINSWWFLSPWQPYYLHWDDRQTWPDPWQLLSDNTYCDLARGLGILYTITLLDRPDIKSTELVLTDSGLNLVQVNKTKYILNWSHDTIVNTNQEVKIIKKLTQEQVSKQYN